MTQSALWVVLTFILISNDVEGSFCSSKSEVFHFHQTVCSDPLLGNALQGLELKRLTNLTHGRCATLCHFTPDCCMAVDVTIEGQKTCTHISGMDKTSVTPDYISHTDCTVFIVGGYNTSCLPGSRFSEHSLPSKCNSGWIAGLRRYDSEMKIHTVSNLGDEAGVTLIYAMSRISVYPPYRTEAYPFMSYNFVNRSLAIPATREARHMEDTFLQIARVYTNGTQASLVETNVSSVLLFSREETNLTSKIKFGKTEKFLLYFRKGYRVQVRDYSVMERDPDNDGVCYHTLNFMEFKKKRSGQPVSVIISRYDNEGTAAANNLHWFNETAYNVKLNLQVKRTTHFENCWKKVAENKLDVMKCLKAKVRDEGRHVRVLLDEVLSADVLFMISTDEDVIAVTAPYIESPDKSKEIPNPSIMVFTSVNSDGVQTQQKITYEGSTFHQVVNNGGGHDVKWFLSTRNWRRILRVTPSNEVKFGSESDVTSAANLSHTVSACVVHTIESWCFSTRAVAIMPDGEVLIQSAPIPRIIVQGEGKIFQDAPDLQVVMLTSRGGCQKLVYKMGLFGENLTACPSLKWLDWFVENY